MKKILNHLRSEWYKYVLEILVIIIGIYGAFALDNWKENRKSDQFESEVLMLIDQNVKKDSLALVAIVIENNRAIRAIDYLLSVDIKTISDDSIANLLGVIINFERFRPTLSAFEVLKSNGLNRITNHELRAAVSSYYDDDIQQVLQSLKDVENAFNVDFVPWLKTDFRDFNFKEYARPYDPKGFVSGREFNSYLRIFRDNRQGIYLPVERAFSSIGTIRKLSHAI